MNSYQNPQIKMSKQLEQPKQPEITLTEQEIREGYKLFKLEYDPFFLLPNEPLPKPKIVKMKWVPPEPYTLTFDEDF